MKLFKDILSRFFIGFAFATLLGCVINLFISAVEGGGAFIAVMPSLGVHFKTELAAVTCQFVLVGLIGVVFAEGALVFKIEKWSIVKQFAVHFIITAVFYTPFVYICWLPENPSGIAIMLVNFIFTYALTYFIQYRQTKTDVEKINRAIEDKNTFSK